MSRHERPVYNLIARMLRDPAQAEDVAQEVFLRAFRNLSTFDAAHKFSNWILRIAHNAAIDAIRRRQPQVISLDDEAEGRQAIIEQVAAPPSEDGLSRLEQRDAGRALEAALARLRPDYRRLVVLRYHEDLSYEEIADITGLPLGSVKSFLHRARSEMAAFLVEAGWRP